MVAAQIVSFSIFMAFSMVFMGFEVVFHHNIEFDNFIEWQKALGKKSNAF